MKETLNKLLAPRYGVMEVSQIADKYARVHTSACHFNEHCIELRNNSTLKHDDSFVTVLRMSGQSFLDNLNAYRESVPAPVREHLDKGLESNVNLLEKEARSLLQYV